MPEIKCSRGNCRYNYIARNNCTCSSVELVRDNEGPYSAYLCRNFSEVPHIFVYVLTDTSVLGCKSTNFKLETTAYFAGHINELLAKDPHHSWSLVKVGVVEDEKK
jgi:hypothetical protein